METSLLEALVAKLQPLVFRQGETILRQDEENRPQEDDVQVIVLEGSVDKQRFKKNERSQVIGTQFMKRFWKDKVISDDTIGRPPEQRCYKRDFSLVANEDCKVLLCTRTGYNMVLSVYRMDKERICQKLLKKVPILRNWSIKKVIEVSEHFQKRQYEPGETIYDIGDRTDNIYFIKSGSVQLQLHYMISETRTFPVSKQEVMRKTSSMIVQRIVREIHQGRQFGFEDMVMQQKDRLFKAKAIGKKKLEVLYL